MNHGIRKNTFKMGIIALLVSAIITALSQVYYANKVQGIHPFLFTGISFFVTAVYFQAFAFKQKVKVQWQEARRPLLLLNMASIITFMGFYFALKYIEPAIVSSLEMGIGPLFILLLAVFQKTAVRQKQWYIAIGTFIACAVLISAVLFGESGVKMQLSIEVILGIVASLLCGVGAVFCSIYSKQLNELGWTSSMILAKRYIGIIIISFLFTYDLIIPYFKANITWILLITVLGVMLPMYLLQKGIQYTNTFIVMMSLCFIPVFTFAFQLFDARIQFSGLTFIGVSLLFLFGVLSILGENKEIG
ncbi:DMT family transporter [Solibacillus sp. FSL K6-1523]|uniref:DMT family transporter n=1 Tax=Solibacillus sp. FSL K6-1523 TaxID=2921471 RepID=UPI0030F8145A